MRAFLSPANTNTSSCDHFLPCLRNPRTSPDCSGRAGPSCGYQPSNFVSTHEPDLCGGEHLKLLGWMPWTAAGESCDRAAGGSYAKLEHAGVVSGTSVLLSAIIVLIYVIPVTLVRMQAFIVAKLSPETRINALWLHNGPRSLSQRSIPINTTLCARYSPVHMVIFGINVLKRFRIAFRTKGFQCCGSATCRSPLSASRRILP